MDRPGEIPLGTPLPPLNAHAITVSIPKWKDFVGYQEGDSTVTKHMLTGYPRFVIHALATQLAEVFVHEEGQGNENCLVFPTESYAHECKAYLLACASNIPPVRVRQKSFVFDARGDSRIASVDVHAVFYPNNIYKFAKQFWQHTGFGISSRLAQRCLDLLRAPELLPPARYGTPSRLHNTHNVEPVSSLFTRGSFDCSNDRKQFCTDNICSFSAMQAKAALRNRIADLFAYHNSPGHKRIGEGDVFLYPTGMTAIWHAHKLLMNMRPTLKFVCFGFPYLDTLKILEKWGPGCHFFGHDHDFNLKQLEDLLSSSQSIPPISALFCEIPSNPRLQSPPIDRLRVLADKYDFLIVVDDTIGSPVNVNVLPYVDIVVTSLSKYICGYADALGGSLVLNPRMNYYQQLKSAQTSSYEDAYFEEDVIVMEKNSRDFAARMRIFNSNTNSLCEFLRSRSLLESPTSDTFVIKEIFYPKWISRQQYDICRVKRYADGQSAEDNFGGLFSLMFVSPLASRVFHDALSFAKGPSLGTNFTLVCPYTILAHYAERDWAAEYGVDEHLVRVSVGLEDQTKLLDDFGYALREAEKAVKEIVD